MDYLHLWGKMKTTTLAELIYAATHTEDNIGLNIGWEL